jgi:hypothetical protein
MTEIQNSKPSYHLKKREAQICLGHCLLEFKILVYFRHSIVSNGHYSRVDKKQ